MISFSLVNKVWKKCIILTLLIMIDQYHCTVTKFISKCRFTPMFNFYSRVLIFFIVNLIMFLRQSWYKGWHKGPVWTAWPPTQGTITSHNGWDSRTNPHPHQCNASPSRNSPNTPCLGPGHFCLIHWLPVIVTCVLTLTFQFQEL